MNIKLAANANQAGLNRFAAADPDEAIKLLKTAYLHWAEEKGILVNLGLALMQKGLQYQAEKCYQIAIKSNDLRTRRSARKNLGFLYLWRGEWDMGWFWHHQRFEGEPFLITQWNGESLNGKPILIWNDVGMGDAFQFVRYTLPLVERGEKVILAVHKSQIDIFKNQLKWPLFDVVDREEVKLENHIHIPLMGLIPLIDKTTSWGKKWQGPTWITDETNTTSDKIGICWASNPADRTMHHYKSSSPEELINTSASEVKNSQIISLQTNEPETHKRLNLRSAKPCWQESLKEIRNCKLIISVDTAIAHLAAGAKKPVKILLPKIADWRWQQALSKDSKACWYPELKLIQKM